MKRPEKPSATDPWLNTLDRYLEAHLSDPYLGIPDIASALNLSERHFYRKVKKKTGYTPLRYLRRLRLQRAHLLLENEQVETPGELAAAVGFIKTDYFSRLFHQHYGYTPYEWLRRTQI